MHAERLADVSVCQIAAVNEFRESHVLIFELINWNFPRFNLSILHVLLGVHKSWNMFKIVPFWGNCCEYVLCPLDFQNASVFTSCEWGCCSCWNHKFFILWLLWEKVSRVEIFHHREFFFSFCHHRPLRYKNKSFSISTEQKSEAWRRGKGGWEDRYKSVTMEKLKT